MCLGHLMDLSSLSWSHEGYLEKFIDFKPSLLTGSANFDLWFKNKRVPFYQNNVANIMIIEAILTQVFRDF